MTTVAARASTHTRAGFDPGELRITRRRGRPRRIVVVPAKEWEVQDLVRDAGCRVAIFAPDADITRRDRKVARAAAYCDGGRIVIETREGTADGGTLHPDAPPDAQAAAALAAFTLYELHPHLAEAGAAGAVRRES